MVVKEQGGEGSVEERAGTVSGVQ